MAALKLNAADSSFLGAKAYYLRGIFQDWRDSQEHRDCNEKRLFRIIDR